MRRADTGQEYLCVRTAGGAVFFVPQTPRLPWYVRETREGGHAWEVTVGAADGDWTLWARTLPGDVQLHWLPPAHGGE